MSVCRGGIGGGGGAADEMGPVVRGRSSSANEASKPIMMLHRRQTHVGNKPLSFSPVSGKCLHIDPFRLYQHFHDWSVFLIHTFYTWASLRKRSPIVCRVLFLEFVCSC